ncbi:MAG TPA: T9SS type A sorting domain-containing protein [Candidatus Kapabacteria bacterium]|nr:T9SS type A sorting domain-containing protein [Candidatus Kapabacteria bacterium]
MIRQSLSRVVVALFVLVLAATEAYSQKDSVEVRPKRSGIDCDFSVTVKNRNGAQKAIDEVVFKVNSTDGVFFSTTTNPAKWNPPQYDPDFITDTIYAQEISAFIQPGKDLAGFDFAYTANSLYDKPTQILYETWSAGSLVSSGVINPVCTAFQSWSQIDTVTVFTQLSGPDPCFNFTLQNRNSFQPPDIYTVRIQLLTTSSGTFRPSTIKPPTGWVVDSVTAYNVYFRTVDNPILSENSLGGFQACLRGNPAATKHDFVWEAYDREHAPIDRDTLRNIPIQALSGSIATDNDIVLAAPLGGSGCIYGLTVKNYHVSNVLAPSPISKVVLTMQTPSVTFDAAPSAPAHWTKTLTPTSITYTADAPAYAIQSSVVSTDFKFSVTGSNNNDFTVNWETWGQAVLSTGSFTSKCTTAAPRHDEASVGIADQNDPCKLKITISNKHNVPASDINTITLSIPSSDGVIIPSSSSLSWNYTNTSGNEIKITSLGTAQTTNQSQEIIFTLTPTTPGAAIQMTWKTFEDVAAQKQVDNGIIPISCTPGSVVKPNDTVTLSGSDNDCLQHFSVLSRNGSTVTKLTLTPTNDWLIDQVIGTPSGWTANIDGTKQFVTFTSSTGVTDGQTLGGFDVKFIGFGTQSLFTVSAETQNQASISSTSIINLTCTPSAGVEPGTPGAGLTDISIVPNPTTSSSQLRFIVNSEDRVWISVFDELGKSVTVAANQLYAPGAYEVPLILNDQPAGSYYIRIQSSHGVITKRLVKH